MFDRILVPTDFSPPSNAALEQARVLAGTFGSSLRLLHVVDEPSSSSFVADGFAPTTDSIRETMLAEARSELSRLAGPTDRSKTRVYIDAVLGAPAATIVDYAKATGTSLIVMGTHGRTGLAHLLMGSVAEQVVRTAPCAVLTVREAPVAQGATAVVRACALPTTA